MATLVVTGGSGGIGAAICERAAAAGWDVVVNYSRGAESAAAVVQRIEAAGGHALAVRANIANPHEVAALFTTADAWRGPVTGLVNNAGISGGATRVADLTPDALTEVLAVNVAGAFCCAGEAVRRMSTAIGGTGGAIVNISSRAAVLGSPGEWVHYAASKAALDTLTVGLAKEVATEGIRVNGVAVGLVDTAFHESSGEADRPARLRPTIPMQRSGTPAEVAAAVVWLLSEEASYSTGTVLAVSGGR